MTLWWVGWRLLLRELRSGELTLLLLALLVAVASSTSLDLFANRLSQTMIQQAAELLAADLAVHSHDPMPETWRQQAALAGLRVAETAEFSSVLIERDEMLLSSVKAVTTDYPLRGNLRISNAETAAERIARDLPAAGSVWVEPRVLSALHLQIGDTLTVGEKTLRITQLLTFEPDRRADWFSFTPRVLINYADLIATGIIQPGSHVHYGALFAGEQGALLGFKRWLQPRLNSAQRLLDVHEDRPEAGKILQRAEQYLRLANLLVVLIAGVAIAVNARRYAERHYDTGALLRCLGVRRRELLTLQGCQLLLLAVCGGLGGGVLGWLIQNVLQRLLAQWLPPVLQTAGFWPYLFGIVNAVLILLAFALPPLWRAGCVAPLRVLRRELEPAPLRAMVTYSLVLLLLAIQVWQTLADPLLTASIIVALPVSLALLAWLLTLLLDRFVRGLSRCGICWRLALQSLLRQRSLVIGQLLALAITLTALLVSLHARNDVIGDWQAQLPAHAPNHFALNLLPGDLPAYRDFLHQHALTSSEFYPIVRGRLLTINGQPARQVADSGGRAENALNRDLSLTWAETLPSDNRIVAGQWWQNTVLPDPPTAVPAGTGAAVSVEVKLAESLRIKVGDRLGFDIAGQPLEAVVASLRSLHWERMTPNFYMIFALGSLDGQPYTYLSSFYLAPAQKPLLNSLGKQFPTVTLLEVDRVLAQLQTIVWQISKALDIVLLLALMAGVLVLFATVRASLDARLQENAVLRALGAGNSLLWMAVALEFAILGGVAGGMAALLSEGLLWFVYEHIFNLHYQLHTMALWLAPGLGAGLIALLGLWQTRRIYHTATLQILLQE